MKRVMLASLVAIAALGCALLVNLDDLQSVDAGYPTCEAGVVTCMATCDTNIMSDPKNCGGCNRACSNGGACADGVCPTTSFTVGDPVIRYLTVDATSLYWFGAPTANTGSIRHAPKNTGVPLPDLATNVAYVTGLAVDAKLVYVATGGGLPTG